MNFYLKVALNASVIKTFYYSIKFGGLVFVSRKSKIKLDKGARIERLNERTFSIYLGFNDTADRGAMIYIGRDSSLRLGKSIGVFSGSKIIVMENAVVSIGSNTFLNDGVRLQASERIDVGENCAIGWYCIVTDSDMHGIDGKRASTAPVNIGDRTWLAAKVTVLKGSVVESNTIVSACSIIQMETLAGNSLYSGNPLKKRKSIEKWG